MGEPTPEEVAATQAQRNAALLREVLPSTPDTFGDQDFQDAMRQQAEMNSGIDAGRAAAQPDAVLAPTRGPAMPKRAQTQAGVLQQKLDEYDRLHRSAPQAQQPPDAPMGPPAAAADETSHGPMQIMMSQATPPHRVAGHHEEDRNPFSAATYGLNLGQIGKKVGAQEMLTNAEVEQSHALGKIGAQHAIAQQTQLDEQVRAQAQQQVARQQRMQEYRNYVDQAASGKEDPGRYMASQDTGSRVLMAIGGALGGFLQRHNGGKNVFTDQIQKNIDRDIEAQRAQLATKKWAVGAKMNELGELRAQGYDDAQAKNMIASAQMKIYDQQLKNAMNATNDPILIANGQKAQLALTDEMTKLAREHDQLTHVAPAMVGGGQGSMKFLDSSKFFRTGNNGEGMIVQNDKNLEKVQERTNALDIVEEDLRRLAEARQQVDYFDSVGNMAMKTEAIARLESLSADALNNISSVPAHTLGAQDKGMVEQFAKFAGDPTSANKANMVSLTEASKALARTRKSLHQTYGMQEARQVIVKDANGNVRTEVVGLDRIPGMDQQAPAGINVKGEETAGSLPSTLQEQPFHLQEPSAPAGTPVPLGGSQKKSHHRKK